MRMIVVDRIQCSGNFHAVPPTLAEGRLFAWTGRTGSTDRPTLRFASEARTCWQRPHWRTAARIVCPTRSAPSVEVFDFNRIRAIGGHDQCAFNQPSGVCVTPYMAMRSANQRKGIDDLGRATASSTLIAPRTSASRTGPGRSQRVSSPGPIRPCRRPNRWFQASCPCHQAIGHTPTCVGSLSLTRRSRPERRTAVPRAP
jgi:hypothetical protein